MDMTDRPAHPVGTILVVDDDQEALGVFARSLRRAGFEVETAVDGLQALDIVNRRRLDVIVSDINMPSLNGIQFLRAVRGCDLDVPVVLITGDPTVETAIRAVEYGALRYLTKPFPPATLVDTIRNAVQMRRLALVKREALEVLGASEKQLGDRAALEVTFERALEQLWMAYQPVVSWSAKNIYAYEALVRSHSEWLPAPVLLLDAAERLGRLSDLSLAVRSQVAEDLSRHSVDHTIFVNLHPNDLSDDRLLDADSPLRPYATRIIYEITERASLSGLHDARSRVEALRAQGFRIAIDDLGAGYAGLSTFAILEPNLIKIDMSLVRDIHMSHTKQRVVRSMLDLGRELDIETVVVEGVETAAERDMLVSLGADLLQGYLFGHPAKPFPLQVTL